MRVLLFANVGEAVSGLALIFVAVLLCWETDSHDAAKLFQLGLDYWFC